MNPIRYAPVILSAALIAAHFLRAGNHGLVAAALAAPSILFFRKRWVLYATAGLLVTGALIWVETTWTIVQFRLGTGQSWMRMLAIMAGVISLTIGSAYVLINRKTREAYNKSVGTAVPSVAAFFLTGLILSIVQLKVELPLTLDFKAIISFPAESVPCGITMTESLNLIINSLLMSIMSRPNVFGRIVRHKIGVIIKMINVILYMTSLLRRLRIVGNKIWPTQDLEILQAVGIRKLGPVGQNMIIGPVGIHNANDAAIRIFAVGAIDNLPTVG